VIGNDNIIFQFYNKFEHIITYVNINVMVIAYLNLTNLTLLSIVMSYFNSDWVEASNHFLVCFL